MNTNRNLHSIKVLTEFARDFDDEEDTGILSQFVNKISNIVNTNYNTLSAYPSTSGTIGTSDEGASQSPTSPNKGVPEGESDKRDVKTLPQPDKPVELPLVDSENVGRTPLSVIQRISNMIAQKDNNLHNYKDTDLHKFWMPDSKSKECYECSQKFTTFRRKHHCRLCGQIFCSKCCNQVVPGRIIKCSGDLKVCTYCSKVVLSYLKSPDITADLKSDLQALQADLSTKFSSNTHGSMTSLVVEDTTLHRHRKISVGYHEERLISSPNLTHADRRNILQQSNTIKMLYEEMMKALPQVNRGRELVSFLMASHKFGDNEEAVAIVNAFIEAGYLCPLVVEEGEVPQETLDVTMAFHTFNENQSYKLMNIQEVRHDIRSVDSDGNFLHLRKSLTATSEEGPMLSTTPDSSLYNVAKDFESHDSILSSAGAKPLTEAFCEHEEQLLAQLLQKEHLDANTWSKILINISVRVANQIHPENVCFDSMDIRNFINIKKISAGHPNDSRIIGGVVFSKNVTHKDMATHIEKPRILLLQCPILYQRVEGKFVTLDNLMMQERESLRNVTLRIQNWGPNIVLVHKSVAGIAQEMLRNKGITLVLDVKMSILERLARCFQCDIVTSIDSNIGHPKLGVCDAFYRKTYSDSNGLMKTLMFFEKRYNSRGCCVLLKGAPLPELTKIKKVVSTMIFARYNWKREISFLLDEFARPPSPKHKFFESPNSPQKEQGVGEDPRNQPSERSETTVAISQKNITGSAVEDFSDPLRADLSPSAFTSDPTNTSLLLQVQKTYDNRLRNALSSTILSISPHMTFPLPYLETEIGRNCQLRLRFPDELFYSKQWSSTPMRENVVELVDDQENVVLLKAPHDYVTHQVTAPAESKEEQDLLAKFRAKGGRYPKRMTMRLITKKSQTNMLGHRGTTIEEHIYKDALDLDNHQRLPVLFYSFYSSPKATSSFCVLPYMLEMHFYGQNDIMLGLFLEKYCFRSPYICPSCSLPMVDHVRRYIHSMGCVQVKLREDKRYEGSDKIMMTSYCTICNEVTPTIPISKDAWCLSFAKYLELRFHGHGYRRNYLEDQTQEQQAVCKHSIHRDYVKYFTCNGFGASISYEPIEIWEIALPTMTIRLKNLSKFDKQQVLEAIKKFAVKGYDVYANIHDQIAYISPEVEHQTLNNLKVLLNDEQIKFKSKVEQVQTLLIESVLNTYDINDAMLMVKRTLCESIEQWEPRLHEVALHSKAATQSKGEANMIDNAMICTEDLKSEGVGSPDSKSVDSEFESESGGGGDDGESVKDEADTIFRQKVNSVDSRTNVEPTTTVVKDNSEKKSITQRLAQFLASNSNENILTSPIPPQEHHTLPLGLFPILVHDQDLSSIIAYSVISHEYRKMIEQLNSQTSTNESNQSPSMKRKNDSVQDSEQESNNNPKESTTNNSNNNKSEKKPQSHIDISFQDATTSFNCKIYYAREFDALRLNFLHSPFQTEKKAEFISNIKEAPLTDDCEEIRKAFARSLCRSVEWKARGGKSGSKFCKTIDDQFVLKEMSKTDVGIFENFAPNYFEYINQCLTQNKPTLLAKIFGVYKIMVKKKDHVSERSILVMENLFVNHEISNKFDLKGSERNRLVDTTNYTRETVFLDENLIQMSWNKPLYILTHSSTILKEAINRDSSFLEKNSVMDYSLLVGLDSKENLLVLGIIDYIRTFTFDKRIESALKSTVSSKLPTVVSPKVYKQRFAEAMEKYFPFVPERWEGLSKK